jgi:hypothetical protein
MRVTLETGHTLSLFLCFSLSCSHTHTGARDENETLIKIAMTKEKRFLLAVIKAECN